MAVIAPLKPLQYPSDHLSTLVAPPYDVISPAEREALAARDKHNVVQLILPHDAKGSSEGDAKYAHAAEILAAWRKEGALSRNETAQFLRYEQTFTLADGSKHTRRGFLGLVKLVPLHDASVAPKDRVLPHERTLSGPKEDRLKLFRATRTNLSPGFLLYKDPKQTLKPALDSATPVATFSTPDGIEHSIARIEDPAAIAAIVKGVGESALLIADGHHRYETAVRYRDEARAANANLASDAEPNFFLAFFANEDDPGLVVLPTHRHVHDLPAKAPKDEVLARIGKLFDVKELKAASTGQELTAAAETSGKNAATVVAAFGDGSAYLVSRKEDADLAGHATLGPVNAALRTTDVALLHMGILEDILGITPAMQAAKSNIWYVQDADAAVKELRAGKGDVLFLMNATPAAVVRNVAEAGEVMPQKSTFFFPKVLTGLAMHTLEADRTVSSGV